MNARHASRREAAFRFKLACGDQSRMSLLAPRFNLREVAKQMILLEDHLAHPYKHCPDCICKHLLTIEAFAEEAVTLDQVGIYRGQAEGIAELARQWLEHVADHGSLSDLGQTVRVVRKRLVPLVYDPREQSHRVASRFLASPRCPHQ